MELLSSYLTCTIVFTQVLAVQKCENCLHGECHASGVCTDGCKPGFADKYCKHACQRTCKKSTCELDRNTGSFICINGCVDGYCGQQCKALCPRKILQSTESTNHQPNASTTTISTPSSPLLTTPPVKSSSSPATTASTTGPTTTSADEPTQSAYKPEGIQLFLGIVGTIIAVLLFVLVALKLRFLCRRTAATLTGKRLIYDKSFSDHRDDVQHGVVELLEVPHMVHPGLYCDINEDEMNPEMPVLADCFQNRASSDSEIPDDVMENASNYAHLHNIDASKLEYLTPSD